MGNQSLLPSFTTTSNKTRQRGTRNLSLLRPLPSLPLSLLDWFPRIARPRMCLILYFSCSGIKKRALPFDATRYIFYAGFYSSIENKIEVKAERSKYYCSYNLNSVKHQDEPFCQLTEVIFIHYIMCGSRSSRGWALTILGETPPFLGDMFCLSPDPR